MHNQLKNCLSKKIWKYYFSVLLYWRKRVGKYSNTFHQLLIYRKIRVSRNNLQKYTVRFLICLFKFSSITYHLSSILSNNGINAFPPLWSSCIVIIPGVVFEEEHATIYYIVHSRHDQLKTDEYQNNKMKIYSNTFNVCIWWILR